MYTRDDKLKHSKFIIYIIYIETLSKTNVIAMVARCRSCERGCFDEERARPFRKQTRVHSSGGLYIGFVRISLEYACRHKNTKRNTATPLKRHEVTLFQYDYSSTFKIQVCVCMCVINAFLCYTISGIPAEKASI